MHGTRKRLFFCVFLGLLLNTPHTVFAAAPNPPGGENNPISSHVKVVLVIGASIGAVAVWDYFLDADRRKRRQLHSAALNGDLEKLEDALAAGADPDALDFLGRTPLVLAAANGHVACVEALVRAGADKNKICTYPLGGHTFTALMIAAATNRLGCVKCLLALGADPSIQNKDGLTAVYIAAETGNVGALMLLLNAGANPNVYWLKTLHTALMCAVKRQNPPCVQLLLKAGARTNGIFPKTGWILLMQAAALGDEPTLALLLAHPGVAQSIDAKDQYGATALLLAVIYGRNKNCVERLLKAGASLKEAEKIKKDMDGLTLLMLAVQRGLEEIVALLLAQPEVAEAIDMQNVDGYTALAIAAEAGNSICVGLLLKAGADPRLTTHKGQSALDLASAKNHTECVRLLEAALAAEPPTNQHEQQAVS